MRLIFASAMCCLALTGSALAQAPQPPFVPFTVTETDQRDLFQYLNDNVPPRYGTPIMNFFHSLEQRAAAKIEKEKKPEVKPELPPKH